MFDRKIGCKIPSYSGFVPDFRFHFRQGLVLYLFLDKKCGEAPQKRASPQNYPGALSAAAAVVAAIAAAATAVASASAAIAGEEDDKNKDDYPPVASAKA